MITLGLITIIISISFVIWIFYKIGYDKGSMEMKIKMHKEWEKINYLSQLKICAGCGQNKITQNYMDYEICSEDCKEIIIEYINLN